MNLRNSEVELNIGLDMGTGSCGWSATDGEGQLFHFKKQPTWGARLFDGAETAAAARTPRGQRRRYIRRRWRLDLLQRLFKEEMEKTDPEFFIRLRQSRLHKEDKEEGHADYKWPLFNASDFTERDYYDRFPTIYHLRSWLMTTDEKADIRLIYLAAHNIVKHRGNFLRQESKSLSSKNANAKESIDGLYQKLVDWCSAHESYVTGMKESECKDLLQILSDEGKAPSQKRDDIAALLKVEISETASDNKACNKALAAAMVGLKADFKKAFVNLEAETTSIKLGDDEKVEALEPCIPDEDALLFQSLKAVYSAYVLQGILSYAPGESISTNMIAKYDKYGKDLKTLKDLVKEYVPGEYDAFFRGEVYENTNIYDASKAQGYTKYNLGVKQLGYDNFRKAVEKLFKDTAAVDDPRYIGMMADFGEEKFLRRLKTSDNGSIPYQLHLEELHAILENQGKHYPFLKADREKIESLVSFRIPYYVGPLQTKNAAVDHNGKQRFSWVERIPGKEGVPITPWNWEDVIDKSASAQKFIERMTGECTYLQGEDVLPRCSLLYEEFCVWNEINGAHFNMGDGQEHRFDAADREAIFELFKTKRTVRYKDVEDLLESQLGYMNVHVSGGQGVSSFNSKLNSYRFFRYDVFGKDGKPFAMSDYEAFEEIIKWSTLFEDRSIFEERLKEKYGDRLTAEQIKTIKNKRFAGWGKLSEKFLTGVKVQTNCGKKSIMDVLCEGNPNIGGKNNAMVLMQVLRDEELGFQKRIDEINEERFREIGKSLQVNELPGSPALRRSINQAIRIVDEIVKIHGAPAKNIFIEVTRDDDLAKKKSRTKTRYNQLLEATKRFKDECKQEFNGSVLSDLKASQLNLDDDRLMLYFAQHGKCLYSGKPLMLDQLSSYEIDHIIPRSYIKDNSLENRALVLKEANQAKSDEMLIPQAVRKRMSGYWRMLRDAGLIGDKKFKNLMRDHIDDKAMKGFVARQLVETSQMVKLIQQLLQARYPETNIVAVKASMSHDLRYDKDEDGNCRFPKCREANDFHHAHDAYLACRIGLFIQKRHPKVYENPIAMAHAMKKYASSQAKLYAKDHHAPGTSGFIVNSFMTSGFDKETGEIFKDDWNAEAEVEGIRRALNYRQCYITRMPYEDAGAFWDATIYSPRDAKMGPKLALPLKKGLDPQKYGGFSSQKFAYFFVYEAVNKKGKQVFEFAEVPVWLAPQIEKDPGELEVYARELAAADSAEFVAIERAKILKRQLIEIDGSPLIVTGSKEVRSGNELAFTLDEIGMLDALKNPSAIDEGKLNKFADSLFATVLRHAPLVCERLAVMLDIEEYIQGFSDADLAGKQAVLFGLIAIFNGNNRVVDLSSAGGSSHAGAMRVTYSKVLADSATSIVLVDQSVTGMFERRTRIGL